jgi:hypothetical protein
MEPKPYKFIGFGAMDVSKPYDFIGFGAMDVTKPYKFIGFGALGGRSAGIPTDLLPGWSPIHGPPRADMHPEGLRGGATPYKFIRFGDIYGPKPYKLIGFGDIYEGGRRVQVQFRGTDPTDLHPGWSPTRVTPDSGPKR